MKERLLDFGAAAILVAFVALPIGAVGAALIWGLPVG